MKIGSSCMARRAIRAVAPPSRSNDSDEDLHVNLDGEPMKARRFRVECRPAALPVHLGRTPLLGGA